MNNFQLRPANRSQSKLRLGISGASGSGKTYSALLLASGLAPLEKVAICDTENGSADLYSQLGKYNVITLHPPFTPESYIEALSVCEAAGMDVIIIDSATHVWKGEGGLLEYQSALGGRYQDWAKVTPRFQKFLQAILQSKCHVIVTVRKKQGYSMETENGRVKVKKVGLEDEIRDGFEYELSTTFNLENNHMATVGTGKDRTGLFDGKADFIITKGTGTVLLNWCNNK